MSQFPDARQQNLVQCEVTGEMVPADETVVISGRRVSARGKQILLEQLRTGDAMPGEYEAPGSLRRFGCAVLDGLIGMVVGLVVVFGGLAALGNSANITEADVRLTFLLQLIAGLIVMAYFVFLHGTRGQTLGKMAGKIKVVQNADSSPIGMGTALIRALAFNGPNLAVTAVALVLPLSMITEAFGIVNLLNIFAGVYTIANAITVLVHPQKRAIHDLIAGTRVIYLDA